MGVVTAGDPVTLDFTDRRALTNLSGRDAHLVAARLDSNASLPTSVPELTAALWSNGSDAVASDDIVRRTSLDGDGNAQFTYRPDTPGEYVFYLATDESGERGFVTTGPNNDNITVEGNVTVVGVDQVSVQRGPASVDAPDAVTRGDNATFEVNVSSAVGSSGVAHTLVLYDEDDWTGSMHTYALSDPIDRNFDAQANVTATRSIAAVRGESRSTAARASSGFRSAIIACRGPSRSAGWRTTS